VALIVYFFYVLWRYRQSSLKAYLLIAALLVGQKAAADTPIIHGGQNYTLFDSEGYYTATAGSNTSGVYTYDYLVDNVIVPSLYGLPYTYTYWLTEDENGFETKFIEFYAANPIVLKGYRLRTACNTPNHPNRRPKSWTLKGKKHAGDKDWTILATETNAQLPTDKEMEADYWLTSNTLPYQYFHFEVTAIQGPEEIQVSPKVSYTRYRMELSQLQIIGNNYSANTDLDYATIEGLKHYYAYDKGNDIPIDITVKDMGGKTLTKDTHYTVSYTYDGNSDATVNAIGTYTLTITGTGSYTGQQTASFKVYQALAGKGTETEPYIIADANDWYIFGKYINEDAANVSDKYYKLAATFDNSKEPITEMIATDKNKPFCGKLDGNGRTLHIALKANSDDGCAPFRFLKSAIIKNLTVAGYAATSKKFGASIAVDNLNDGDNKTEITDCYSRVTIASTAETLSDGTHGGFVGENHGSILFTRCAFLGRMLGSTAECNGGFVGWNNDAAKSLTFSQCVFDPVWVTMSENNSKTFSRNDAKKPSIDQNTYFTYAGWGTNQGTQAVALTTAPANLGNVVSKEGTMTLYENALLCGGKYYVTNLSLYDNASNATLLSQADGKQLNVTLSGRTLFKDGNWNTLCLPFDLSMDQFNNLLNGGTLMELDIEGTYDTDKQTGFDPATGILSLYFKDASEIKAGTPYIIKWPSGSDNLENHVFQSVEIDLSDETLTRQIVESADEHVQFIGTFSPVELPIGDKSNLFLGADNTLHWPQTDNYAIRSFRAYFHVDGGSVSAIKLHFGEDENETTGVVSIDNSQLTIDNWAGAWYDLQGRRVANGQKPKAKGIYIYKGKKQVIK
jgi:hypothetical protein